MFWYKDFWIITLIILLIVYMLGKSKHLIATGDSVQCYPMRWSVYPMRWSATLSTATLCKEDALHDTLGLHWENWISISFQIEWDMIMVTVFLSNWIEYDRGDCFPFDFEPNGIQFGSKSKGKPNGITFGSKSKGKPSPRSYPIWFERKWNASFFSVQSLMTLASYQHTYTIHFWTFLYQTKFPFQLYFSDWIGKINRNSVILITLYLLTIFRLNFARSIGIV